MARNCADRNARRARKAARRGVNDLARRLMREGGISRDQALAVILETAQPLAEPEVIDWDELHAQIDRMLEGLEVEGTA